MAPITTGFEPFTVCNVFTLMTFLCSREESLSPFYKRELRHSERIRLSLYSKLTILQIGTFKKTALCQKGCSLNWKLCIHVIATDVRQRQLAHPLANKE